MEITMRIARVAALFAMVVGAGIVTTSVDPDVAEARCCQRDNGCDGASENGCTQGNPQNEFFPDPVVCGSEGICEAPGGTPIPTSTGGPAATATPTFLPGTPSPTPTQAGFEVLCNDGLDNDGDNDIDCGDSDCFGTDTCASPAPTTSLPISGALVIMLIAMGAVVLRRRQQV